MDKQHRPLTADVIYIYDGEWSKYPETVKILMDNGFYMAYRLDVKQPKPQLTGMLDKFGEVCLAEGYRRKEIGGASSQDK